MKVNVDKQGWEMIDSGAWNTVEGTAAVDNTAHSTAAQSSAPGVPGSGVFAKVAEPVPSPTTIEELSAMDTIPAPSSEEPISVIPKPASVPPDLAAMVGETNVGERTG